MDAPALFDALDWATAIVGHPAVAAAWDEPSALPGDRVGGLAAHLFVATDRLATLLEAPEPSDGRVVGLADVSGPNRAADPATPADGLHAFLRDDAASRAAAGPAVIADELRALRPRLEHLVEATPADRLVPVVNVPRGATPLDVYVVTRTIELAVHGDDLVASVPALAAQAPPLPDSVAAAVLPAFVDLAVARSGTTAVLRAFARRERADPETLRVL